MLWLFGGWCILVLVWFLYIFSCSCFPPPSPIITKHHAVIFWPRMNFPPVFLVVTDKTKNGFASQFTISQRHFAPLESGTPSDRPQPSDGEINGRLLSLVEVANVDTRRWWSKHSLHSDQPAKFQICLALDPDWVFERRAAAQRDGARVGEGGKKSLLFWERME